MLFQENIELTQHFVCLSLSFCLISLFLTHFVIYTFEIHIDGQNTFISVECFLILNELSAEMLKGPTYYLIPCEQQSFLFQISV